MSKKQTKPARHPQPVAHHHVVQAHHSGLIIGAVAGSTVVTTVMAVFIAIVSPHSILTPYKLPGQVTIDTSNTTKTVAPRDTTTSTPGAGAQTVQTVGAAGAAAQTELR